MPKLETLAATTVTPKSNQKLKGNGQTKKKNGKPSVSKATAKELVYPRIDVRVFINDPAKTPLTKDGTPSEPSVLSGAIAKDLLQWQTEADAALEIFQSNTKEAKELPLAKDGKQQKVDFGTDYLLMDAYGNKVRCLANVKNRPFYQALANDWKLEVLRRKWKFNGEPIIIDETGMDQDGQHRLIGLILAIQEWELDAKKLKDEQEWHTLWKEEPYLETLVVVGVSSDDETINTMNTGKKRSEVDAIYRSKWLEGKPDRERLALAKILGKAIKFVWNRTSYGDASLAPRRPHSELFEFLGRHERLKEAATAIYQTAEGNSFAEMVPMGAACGLLYLMASDCTDIDSYNGVNSEEAINWEHWEKAYDYFADIGDNGKATEGVREALLGIGAELGSLGYKMRVGVLIKGWHLYSDGKKITKDKVEITVSENSDGQWVISEEPRIGGIDVEVEPKDRLKADPTTTEDRSVCPKNGTHEYITEEGETFCKHCFDPKPVTKKKG